MLETKDILSKYNNIALVGASKDLKKTSKQQSWPYAETTKFYKKISLNLQTDTKQRLYHSLTKQLKK